MSVVTDNQLGAKVDAHITSNGNNDIEGNELNEILHDIKDSKAHISHTHTKSQVGLGNVDNTPDTDKPISTAQQAALDNKADLIGGKIDPNQLPNLAITQYLGEVADETDMLSKVGQRGDWVIRQDDGLKYVLISDDYAEVTSWKDLPSGGDGVSSVNGQTGNVNIDKSHIGLGNVDNTPDTDKPVSTAQQAALDGKLDKPIVTSSTGSGNLSFDLSTFTHHDLNLNGDVTSLNLTNGFLYQERVINILKDTDGFSFNIANDHSETQPYNQGEVVGIPSFGSIHGRIYYKAKGAVTAGAFNDAEWELYIKLQDDVLVSISINKQERDQLIITPKRIDPSDLNSPIYYSITPILNV